mgnify:CR=1 FL=1
MIEKLDLTTIISKYYLNGMIESVRWEIKKNKFDPTLQIEYVNGRFNKKNAISQWMKLDKIIGEMQWKE